MKKNRIKKRTLRQIFPLIFFVLLLIYCISLLIPMAWALMSSLKSRLDFRMDPLGFPTSFAWENYVSAFNALYIQVSAGAGVRNVYLLEMFGYTLAYAVGATIAATLAHMVVAYICAKYTRFRITKVLYTIVIVTMILPIVGSLPSEMQVVRTLGLYNNILGAWIMKATFLGTHFLIFYATFKGISWEYAEAAFMDGASHARVMFQIMFPLAKTTVSAIALLSFIGFWNDANMSMIYMPDIPTVAYGLFRFQFSTGQESSSITVQLAGCTIVMFPIFVLYMCFKKQLIGNIAIGGIKG
ncbi:MAG TPA: carbohydrate ABC transporter permease [Candidatus Borkfalkia avicola]|uniref:Carbohydrate ABC transporter permease n=1 Tax=Candidatus Borkfalkia avicola TaxID=2838503 RepID=A0A9D2D646_9FIRM|nr:carbohydrate ABC transporter permease [Candidatus Borkfalkia avicola]